MVKIEFFLQLKKKRDEVRQFYESLGLTSSSHGKYIRLKSTEHTSIVSVTQSRVCLRAQNHRDILEMHKDSPYDLETAPLEEDVEINHAHRNHHIPFRIKLVDPLGNSVCISPSLQPKTLAILTSGGDAPGMNSAIWAVTKAAARNGARVLGVFGGYEGLIAGNVRDITEREAAAHMFRGGTFLRSARSAEFQTDEGLQKAASTVHAQAIDAVVIIGGDGTMRGAEKLAKACPEVTVVFIPGSIDNDIPGTESIGAATALHRIIEAVDCIESTMTSHGRAFVLEVMGRDCGWLALMAAFSTDAAYVFVPEFPQAPGWEVQLKHAIQARHRACTYVVIAEGARTDTGTRITTGDVCAVLEALGIDSRAVVLGHTQRGGPPCASDRIMAPTLGVAAAEVALSRHGAFAILITDIERVHDLSSCVRACNKVPELVHDGEAGVSSARGRDFTATYSAFMKREGPGVEASEKFAVMTVGALAAGVEDLISHLKRHGRVNGAAIHELDRAQIVAKSGGKQKQSDAEYAANAKAVLQSLGCATLVIIGGLDALAEATRLKDACRRIIVLPCTISNNLPGTNESVGSDTALDTITALCDNLKISSARRVAYVVEVHGGGCGYLSIATALAMGASDCYFPEETGIIRRFHRTVRALNSYFKKQTEAQLIVRGNGAMKGVCNETIAKILEVDGSANYVVRHCSLGHVQKGNLATAIDRVRASKLALAAFDAVPSGAWLLGTRRFSTICTPVEEAALDVSEDKRRVKKATWMEMARTYRVLN